MITEDEPADGVGGCLDLPPKQSLTDLTFVFSNTGLASLVKTITLYAQPYITSPDMIFDSAYHMSCVTQDMPRSELIHLPSPTVL